MVKVSAELLDKIDSLKKRINDSKDQLMANVERTKKINPKVGKFESIGRKGVVKSAKLGGFGAKFVKAPHKKGKASIRISSSMSKGTVSSIASSVRSSDSSSKQTLTSPRVGTHHKLLRAKLPSCCLYFNRFGKCRALDKCVFIHDPKKVAICRNFIVGKCTKQNCLLSHEFDMNKMPDCKFFLRNGKCNTIDCRYRHVKLEDGTGLCPEFKAGYCQSGISCKFLHDFYDDSVVSGIAKSINGNQQHPKLPRIMKNALKVGKDSKSNSDPDVKSSTSNSPPELLASRDEDGIEIYIPVDVDASDDSMGWNLLTTNILDEPDTCDDLESDLIINTLFASQDDNMAADAIQDMRSSLCERFTTEKYITKLLDFLPDFMVEDFFHT